MEGDMGCPLHGGYLRNPPLNPLPPSQRDMGDGLPSIILKNFPEKILQIFVTPYSKNFPEKNLELFQGFIISGFIDHLVQRLSWHTCFFHSLQYPLGVLCLQL